MEGRVDREVFGVLDRVPMRFTPVLSREGDFVTLAAGSAHGATVGSRYAVFPQGTKVEGDATPVGAVEVTAVRVVDADARIVESADDPALQPGARAVETTHVHDAFRLVVEFADRSGDAEAAAAARATLEGSSLLEVVDEGSGSAAARVYLLSPRDAAGDEAPVPQLGALAAPTLAAVDGTGALLMPPRKAGEHGVVRENLERIAKYRQVLSLENPDSYSPMKGRFSIVLLRHGADGSWVVAESEEAGGLVVYEAGDAIAFRITSDHDAPVFMSLLDFGLTGGVSQVYPAPGTTEKLEGGMSFDIGTRPGTKPYTVAIPRELAAEFTEAVETLKLFATSVPADLSVLSQAGVRSAERRAPDSPLSALLRAASHGGVREVIQPIGEDDWTTALRPFVVRRRGGVDLNADGSTLNLGSVSLSTPGLEGRVAAQPGASGRAEAQAPTPAALATALAASKMTVQDTVLVTAPTPPRAGSRGAGVEPSVEITARAPAPGYDQAVLATDELGVLSWHLPEPAADGTRAGPGGRLTYRIPYGEKGRGMAAAAALVALKVLVFPRWEAAVGAVAQSAFAKWEAQNRPYRVRWFGPTDHTQEEARLMDAEGWKSLAGGRSLLFVHGTTSMAHSAFGDLPVDFMEEMSRRYDGRVFALDHPTVSEDPRDNVRWFLEQIPDGTHLDVDIVCHSRGGLVSRILAERLSEFPMGARSLDVGRVVFVGSPNAGTKLADGRYMGSFLDTYTNMVCRLPGSMVMQALQVVLAVVKQLAFSGAEAALLGLRSMVPGGEFNAWLNNGKDRPTARYHALASNYEPSEPGLVRLANATLLGKIFDGPHDLVVPVPSVVEANGASSFPIQDRVVFQGPDSMSHMSYFGNPAVQKQLSTWLAGASRPS